MPAKKISHTITLTNDFHHSSISLKRSTAHPLSAREVARARRALCGINGCTCAGVAGTRGTQHLPDGRRFKLIATENGKAIIEIA